MCSILTFDRLIWRCSERSLYAVKIPCCMLYMRSINTSHLKGNETSAFDDRLRVLYREWVTWITREYTKLSPGCFLITHQNKPCFLKIHNKKCTNYWKAKQCPVVHHRQGIISAGRPYKYTPDHYIIPVSISYSSELTVLCHVLHRLVALCSAFLRKNFVILCVVCSSWIQFVKTVLCYDTVMRDSTAGMSLIV